MYVIGIQNFLIKLVRILVRIINYIKIFSEKKQVDM